MEGAAVGNEKQVPPCASPLRGYGLVGMTGFLKFPTVLPRTYDLEPTTVPPPLRLFPRITKGLALFPQWEGVAKISS